MERHYQKSKSSFYVTEEKENNVSATLDSISMNSEIATEIYTDTVRESGDYRDHRVNSSGDGNLACATGCSSDSDSDDNFQRDEDVETGEVFEEIRQQHGTKIAEKTYAYTRPVPGGIKTLDIEEFVDGLLPTTYTEEPVKSCANCCKSRRVEHVSWLKAGQHIKVQGNHLTFTYEKYMVKVYHHHAIVKRVNKTIGNSVELVLIHFSKPGEKSTINEAVKTYDLENDEIYIIEYMRPRYSREEIIKRAESMVPKQQNTEESKQFGSYNVFCCNCEHFASWCVVGEGESFQANGVLKSSARIFSKIAGSGCKIRRFITQYLYNATDEIAVGFDFGKHLPGLLLGATGSVYLIYSVAMAVSYFKKYRRGMICKVCFKRKLIALLTHFGAFCTVSSLSYILVHFISPIFSGTPFGIPLLLILVFLSVSLQWGIGKVVKKLMSPYACDAIEIKKLSDITRGAIISFKYFGFSHYAIVTGNDYKNDESEIGTITCVHYGLKGYNVLGTREVIEESFKLNLKKNIKDVKLIDCRQLKTYPPGVVVERVEARIGETKWNLLSNRTDHFCFDAKVLVDKGLCFDTVHLEDNSQEKNKTPSNDIAKSNSKHKSSLYVGKKEIHLRSDLQTGHIVKYKGQSGIVVYLEDMEKGGEQNFRMELIVYRNYHAISETYTVNLKKERLFIIKYHPSHCCPMNERVQRARERQGIECKFWTADGFFESCILRDTE